MNIENVDMLFDGEKFVIYDDGNKTNITFLPVLLSEMWRVHKSFEPMQQIILNDLHSLRKAKNEFIE